MPRPTGVQKNRAPQERKDLPQFILDDIEDYQEAQIPEQMDITEDSPETQGWSSPSGTVSTPTSVSTSGFTVHTREFGPTTPDPNHQDRKSTTDGHSEATKRP